MTLISDGNLRKWRQIFFHKSLTYSWKAKVGCSILFITTIFCKSFSKANIPFYSPSNSLSNCLCWCYIAFILRGNTRVKQTHLYDHIPNQSIFLPSFCPVFSIYLGYYKIFLEKWIHILKAPKILYKTEYFFRQTNTLIWNKISCQWKWVRFTCRKTCIFFAFLSLLIFQLLL